MTGGEWRAAEGFDQKWQAYWTRLPPDPTLDVYAKAATRTITGLLARATAQKQKFASFDDFAAAIQQNKIALKEDDWLPQDLIDSALTDVTQLRKRGAGFALVAPSGSRGPTIVCTLGDGKKLVGRFRLNNGHVGEVIVDTPR